MGEFRPEIGFWLVLGVLILWAVTVIAIYWLTPLITRSVLNTKEKRERERAERKRPM